MCPLEMSTYSVVVVVRWECAESLSFGDFHISIRRGPRKNLISLLGTTTEKPTFYEQVTDVKLLFLLFLHRASAFVVVLGFVAPHVALHRVSIRTLDELS